MLWMALFVELLKAMPRKGLLPALNGLTAVPISTAGLHSDGSWGSETYILLGVMLSIQSLLIFPPCLYYYLCRNQTPLLVFRPFAGKNPLRDNKGCSNCPDCWPKLLGMRWTSPATSGGKHLKLSSCTCHWHRDMWTQIAQSLALQQLFLVALGLRLSTRQSAEC